LGIGGAGCNALNNMISSRQLSGEEFLALNTDAQHLSMALAENHVQLGSNASLDDDNPMILTGLRRGANPDASRAAADES
jgi:cell division protein FtsZ